MGDSMRTAPHVANPLPLAIGVTGHRDLREVDRLALEKQVRSIFDDLQSMCPKGGARCQFKMTFR